MLGIKIGEEFKISIYKLSLWKFDSYKGLLVKHNEMQDWIEASRDQYMKLLNGFYQIEKLPFKPKEDERYWFYYIRDDEIGNTRFSETNTNDLMRVYCGNCFHSEAEAEKYKHEIYEKLTGKKWEERKKKKNG